MSALEQIDTAGAPGAVGPYSQAIALGNLILTSGSLPIAPDSKAMPEGVKEQAAQCLSNLKAILEAAGGGMDRVIKATVFLTDMNNFAAVNEVYATFFAKPFPARSCFAVAALPMGAKVEIEVVAAR